MRLTVVIPTRERCDTLRVTLRTCLDQAQDGFRVVVSDNASTDDTRAVVESFEDPRVRYVNTGRRVSMAGNWEFALDAVDDEAGNFVHFLGDDDALLPGALDDVMGVLKATGARALGWRKADYVWPSWAQPEWRNRMVLPLQNKLFRYDSAAALRDVKNLWLVYYRCPSLYNSFVDARLVHDIRRREGRFFHSSIPDAYSGFALLSELDSYLYSTRPFTLNGGSGHSTGASFGGSRTNAGPRERFLAENDLPTHPKLESIPGSTVLPVMEALYQANDHVFGGRLRIVRPLVIAHFFREISRHSEERWDDTLARLEASARARHDTALGLYIKAFRRLIPRVPGDGEARGRPASGVDAFDHLGVDLAPFGVRDVHDAAAWAGALLGPYERPAQVVPYAFTDKILARVGQWVERRVPDRTL